ncbi:hypothetical protein SETIT_6G101100v2 [Setaria italica]|uniref:Rad21/Rec8-like protein N-terminal domain-containing protein n=1 Tax=Setaria italica TaxID=4555 RepID=K3YGI7_SETIT|nr:sister chromatid cohesion 1 protein 3 [Setaria italica]RCV30511.1 hypothetical protein SETIT_6G101100v2 [Setaria italica]
MFYSHTILARKSPLGTVWIAAHLERKIKKPQIDGIDIPSYAESIMFPEVPIALRLSGHLLLGLVRIYSWKVNYLFQDCNRMVTTIRTAFASVQVDLPVDADRAPFESITLPPTLNLDDLNLDDAIFLMETPDSHQKTRDQITLPEGEYVMIELDEGARVEPSVTGPSLHMEPTPIEDETFPPFHDGFGADNRNEEIPIDRPPGNLPVNSNVVNQTDEALDPPETMRAQESPGLMLTDSILGNDEPMDFNNDPSPFVQNKAITPPVIDETSSAGRQAPGRSIPNLQTPNTYDAFVDDAPLNFDTQLPEFQLEPSPPPVQENVDNRRPKAQVNKRKRKRKVKFDHEIILSNDYMKEQIDGAGLDKLICKRRKLPQTALDVWRFSRTNRKGSFLLEPVLHGMCTNLHETYERNFSRVSGPDAECTSGEPAAGVANDGLDAPPERQLSPNYRGTGELPPDLQLTPNPPGNVDAQPEPLPSPKSPGAAGAAPDDDMLPELPRFSPMDMPSPVRGNDTPYRTPGGTPPSWLGGTGVSEIPSSGGNGTGVSEIPSSGGNYSLPGQSTRDTDHMPFLFPINEDDDDQPEIPGLMSTPGGVSSVGTGTTRLGSMSTRTRAVAMFFKDHVPSTSSDGQPGKFSLNKILEGKARKQAARMFFETTVLKSYDYIDVQQEEPYGDIEISVKPSLSTAKL